MKRLLGLVVLCGIVFCAVQSWSGKAAEPATHSAAVDFEGKWLGIELDRALERHGAWLHKAHVQLIGGQPCLIGTAFSVDDDGNVKDYFQELVPLAHIEQIVVFETLDELKKTYEKKQ